MGIDDLLYPEVDAIDKAIDEADESSIFGSSVEIPFLAFSYKIMQTDHELMTLSLSSKTRFLSSTILGANFLKLLWNGNKQFEGRTVDLGEFGLSTFGSSEIALGWAMPVTIGENLKVRLGSSFKYLVSGGGAYLPRSNARLTTGEGGKFIAISNLNNQLDVSLLEEDALFTGNGLALDLSATVALDDNVKVSFAVLDLGRLNFSDKTNSFQYSAKCEL